MTEPFRVKTWLDAKYLQDVSFVKKFRETPDEPVEDFVKKNGKQTHERSTDRIVRTRVQRLKLSRVRARVRIHVRSNVCVRV